MHEYSRGGVDPNRRLSFSHHDPSRPTDSVARSVVGYNTGSFERGFFNGYVAKYYGPNAGSAGALPIITASAYRPARPAPPPNPYTADPSVYTRKEAFNG